MSNFVKLIPYRSSDAAAILELLVMGQPVSVVGLSNFGKSSLLRRMADPEIAATYEQSTGQAVLFVYADCNRMLEMSAQGFYEVILRAILEAQEAIAPQRYELAQLVEGFYRKVVESGSAFAIPLAFNDAIIALVEDQDTYDVVLMLDEFDDVLTGLDERVFLNLRALKDRYASRLNYLTATLRPLSATSGGDNLGEFNELFAANRYHLKPLNDEDAATVAADIFRQANDSLDPPERDFILSQAGGHPGLIQAVAHVVLQVESGAPATYTDRALNVAADVLQNDLLARSELNKLWNQLTPGERDLVTLVATQGIEALPNDLARASLFERGLLVEDRGELRLFADLFANYARRKGLVHPDTPDGVRVDIDAGTVWVAGRPVEPLTDLEYRLLLLLYGRLDKICDKYQIVEAVWGQDYLGEVDDARIEKLVSRLRSKLEIDPSTPSFVITVRGRGYKLSSSHRSPGD